MLIAIDHGNSSIKTPDFVFTSALERYPSRPPLAGDYLEYDGYVWALSEERIPYKMDKTENENFFILSLFAIAKHLHKAAPLQPYMEIDLAVGLPPEHFIMLRTGFADYFKREAIKFVYNDIPACVKINRVFVYPQAYAAVVPQGTQLLGVPRVFVVDIGGYTTDVLLLKKGNADLKFCRSFEYGVIKMSNQIIGKVNAKYGMKLEEDQIISAIQGDTNMILAPDVLEMIRQEAETYAAKIIDVLRENEVELKANPVIFIGGGSVLFKPYIEQSPLIAKADFILDAKANAIGYAMLGTAQLKRASV